MRGRERLEAQVFEANLCVNYGGVGGVSSVSGRVVGKGKTSQVSPSHTTTSGRFTTSSNGKVIKIVVLSDDDVGEVEKQDEKDKVKISSPATPIAVPAKRQSTSLPRFTLSLSPSCLASPPDRGAESVKGLGGGGGPGREKVV